MTIMCRLLELSPDQRDALTAHPESLATTVAVVRSYSDVYRYWHAIEYLLAQHQPASLAANWLALGQAVSPVTPEIPAARLLSIPNVAALSAVLEHIAPEDLGVHYEASALDQAGIYPCCWQEWEETFDPLGQVLEHYWFLREFVGKCAVNGNALLLYFVDEDDDTDA